MLLSATDFALARPVTSVPAVRQVVPARGWQVPVVPVPAARDVVAPTWESLRKIRSETLAELETDGGFDENASRYLALERDQLASMAYDRNQVYAVEERRSAWRQLQENDTAFLARAGELADISGDERVLLQAQIDLETMKSPIERAVPKDSAGPTVAELTQRMTARTAEFSGTPVSISLRYPSGWGASGADRSSATDAEAKVSAAAARVVQAYRESLF